MNRRGSVRNDLVDHALGHRVKGCDLSAGTRNSQPDDLYRLGDLLAEAFVHPS